MSKEEQKKSSEHQRSPRTTIEKQDSTTNIVGIIAVVTLAIVLIGAVILLIRFLIRRGVRPLTSEIVDTTEVVPSPTPASSPQNEDIESDEVINQGIGFALRDINGVPIDWDQSVIKNIGLAFKHPVEAVVTVSNDEAQLTYGELEMKLSAEIAVDETIRQEALSLRESINDDKQYGELKQVTISGYETYQFTSLDSQRSYLLIEVDDLNYLQVKIDAPTDQAWNIAEDILASFHATSESEMESDL